MIGPLHFSELLNLSIFNGMRFVNQLKLYTHKIMNAIMDLNLFKDWRLNIFTDILIIH